MTEIKIYTKPSYNKSEILRYARCSADAPGISELIDECIAEAEPFLSYRVCFAEFPAEINGDALVLPFMRAKSRGLAKNMSDCSSAVVFAATVGIGIDRLIAKYSRVSPVKALILDALGTERIEGLCDTFNRDVKEKAANCGRFTRPRFSPGYGDLPLEIQSDIFRILDCPRKIGLTLNDGMLMSPSKSVTAIIGISDKPSDCGSGCGECQKTNCEYRRK